MAAVGLYGLIQYSISTRTREIGLRLAIGAGTGAIFRMFVGEGVRLSLTGIAIGLVGALWLVRLASSLLLGVNGSDPLTFTVVSLLLLARRSAAGAKAGQSSASNYRLRMRTMRTLNAPDGEQHTIEGAYWRNQCAATPPWARASRLPSGGFANALTF